MVGSMNDTILFKELYADEDIVPGSAVVGASPPRESIQWNICRSVARK